MRNIKVGIFGLSRGSSGIADILANGGDIVAICDLNEARLARINGMLEKKAATYTDFDEFINHPEMEAILLDNYFHEHAPFAIKALEKNIHVLSECTSNATMAEGVALVRAARKSKAIYMLGENFQHRKYNDEIRRVCQEGTLGKVLFAEGEYNHPLDPTDLAYAKQLHPYAKHWRNFTPASYYITHSLGPLLYATEATPTRVTALPATAPLPDELTTQCLVKSPFRAERAAIISCLNDDGSVFRVTGCAGFGAKENSYRICGIKGQIENIRGTERLLLRYNSWDTPEGMQTETDYMPERSPEDAALCKNSGHAGADFFVVRDFFEAIRENKQPFFDVYRATAMASVAILAHRSMIEFGTPYDVPDFRREADLVKYENDNLTPFFGSDGSEPNMPWSAYPSKWYTEEGIALYDELASQVVGSEGR